MFKSAFVQVDTHMCASERMLKGSKRITTILHVKDHGLIKSVRLGLNSILLCILLLVLLSILKQYFILLLVSILQGH